MSMCTSDGHTAQSADFRVHDLPAMGVVTYFLLCGYTPFGAFRSSRVHLFWPDNRCKLTKRCGPSRPSDRENQVDEVQAICNADYAFEPAEYWMGVSETGALSGRAHRTSRQRHAYAYIRD